MYMRKINLLLPVLIISLMSYGQKKNIEWISSTSSQQWIEQKGLSTAPLSDSCDV